MNNKTESNPLSCAKTELVNINTSVLVSGLPYQRELQKQHLEKLIREWSAHLMEPLVVSYRDGKFYLVDGQHRAAAIRELNGGKDTMTLCKLYRGLTYELEAQLFFELDQAKRKLNAAQSVNALIQSGSDPEVRSIQRLLNDNGFTWALSKHYPDHHEIIAVRAVISAYRLLGNKQFDRMLYLLDETWHGAPASLRACMLSGMALFLKTYETEIYDILFIKRLSATDPEEIIRKSKTDLSTGRLSLRCARILLKKYNGQRGGRKLPYRFMG